MPVASNNAIPPQGTPGVFDARNPTLLPNFDSPVASGGTLDQQSPAAFLAANPRVDATATATLGGSVTTGDELTIEMLNPVFAAQGLSPAKISASYQTVGGDTLASVAEALATAFNDLAAAQAVDVRADAAAAVITFRHAGPVGNFSTLFAPTEIPATLTVAGTAHTGDQYNVLVTGPGLGATGVLIQSPSTTGNTATQDAQALKTAFNANAALIAAGISAAGAAAVLTLTIPAGDFNVSSWVNSLAPAFTVGGSVTAGDVLSAVFTSAAGLGAASPVTVSYTAKVTDTTTDLVGQGLAAAINANPVLQGAGITAADLTSVVTVSYPGRLGQLRISSSVVGTSTLTSSAAPTATIALATTATETITLSGAGKLSGGSGPFFAGNNFNFAFAGGGLKSFFYGKPYRLGFDVLTQMVNQGMPVV